MEPSMAGVVPSANLVGPSTISAGASTAHVNVEKCDNGFVVRYWSSKDGQKNLICQSLPDVTAELSKAFGV